MKYLRLLLITSLLLVPVTFMNITNSASAAEEVLPPVPQQYTEIEDGQNITVYEYHYLIEASQWEFKAYDLNRMEDLGISPENREQVLVKHRIGGPEGNGFMKSDPANGIKSVLKLDLVSRDVQHGFSINELNIAVALNRPQPPAEFGEPTQVSADLPEDDATLSGFCHIFCGLGHPDMKIKLIVGEGSPEIGKWVFYGALVVNALILGLTVRSIVTKVKLLPDEKEPVKA